MNPLPRHLPGTSPTIAWRVPETPAPSGNAVTLQQMLERREARAAGQHALVLRHASPLVSLTLVTPGPVKDTADARYVFNEGLATIDTALEALGANVLAFEQVLAVTGPEALFAVDADALPLKRALVDLEEKHPLGRLWDADVIARDGSPVARRQLDMEPRRCLVCEEPAHTCARSARHTLAELQQVIRNRIDGHRACTAR